MSLPNIPDITPKIDLCLEDSLKMILNSVALNDIGLSHIVNTEGEKLQYVLGTLNGDKSKQCCEGDITCVSNEELLEINKSIKGTLREVLRNQIIMQMKMEDTMDLYDRLTKKNKFNDSVHIEVSECKEVNDIESFDCDPIYF